METIEEQINQVWSAEQEILDIIDQVCSKYHLRYSLAYGTLLGAVRHGGFIPWDDDIDIIMPRDDYEKLLSVWYDAAPKGYLVQNTRTDSDFTQNFTKIRKDKTTFLQDEAEKSKHYHKGIFVDIFPGDHVAPGKISRKMQYIFCAINLLYSRGFTSGSGGLIGAIEKFLLLFPKGWQTALRSFSDRRIRRWHSRTDLPYFFPCTIMDAQKSYVPSMFDNNKKIIFSGKEYSCVADPDALLRQDYGDYMQLPPEEERIWKHHPLIVDFHHNYEELEK